MFLLRFFFFANVVFQIPVVSGWGTRLRHFSTPKVRNVKDTRWITPLKLVSTDKQFALSCHFPWSAASPCTFKNDSQCFNEETISLLRFIATILLLVRNQFEW